MFSKLIHFLLMILCITPDYSAFHVTSAHAMILQNAMQLGRQMGAQLPEDVTVIGIAARHVCDFSEELSSPVAEVIPKPTQIVADLLMQ